jgi:rod shape-determining protein MreC
VTLSRRARELVAVAMLLALPVLFLRANVKSPAELNLLDRVVLRLSAPLQALCTGAARAVGHAWSRYLALVHVADDNRRLTDENARLRADLERVRLEAARADSLERLLGLRAATPVETVAAHVIAVETSPYFRVVRLRLDRGGPEVRAGMPVLAPAGVVGRIERVFGAYADVLLAADPKSSIDVVVARTGGRGLVRGVPGDNRYRMRIEYLLRKDEVAAGDVVVTSGLGGIFPRNLPVGKVVRVVRRDFGLYQDAEVEPAVDLAKLSDVVVARTPPADEDHTEP